MLNYLRASRTSPFDSYRLYMAIKLHFGGSYDAFKYHFKTGAAKPSKFEAHKQRFFFERAARTNPTQDRMVAFYVWNFLAGKEWIGEMNDEPVLAKQAYIDSYTYNVRQEIAAMSEHGSLDTILTSNEGLPPPIFTMVDEGLISLETICVINKLVDFIPACSAKVTDPLGMFSAKTNQVLKYQPFLNDLISFSKVKEILISEFTPPTE